MASYFPLAADKPANGWFWGSLTNWADKLVGYLKTNYGGVVPYIDINIGWNRTKNKKSDRREESWNN